MLLLAAALLTQEAWSLSVVKEAIAREEAIVPVEINEDSAIPKGFMGVPPLAFCLHYFRMCPPEDEFEKTYDYMMRIDSAKSRPLLGDLTMQSSLAFRAVDTNRVYDPDAEKEVIQIQPDLLLGSLPTLQKQRITCIDLGDYGEQIGTYEAANGFGVKKEVKQFLGLKPSLAITRLPDDTDRSIYNDQSANDAITVRVRIPAKEAKAISSQLELLIVGHLSFTRLAPVVMDEYMHKPTITLPVGAHTFSFLIYFNVDAVEVYDPLTGKIYLKRKLRGDKWLDS